MSLPLRAIGLLAVVCAHALPAAAGTWGATRSLTSTFGVSSPPESPLVVMNAAGHALAAWNATGPVGYADRPAGGVWLPSRVVPGATTGNGAVAVGIGDNDVSAVAYVTAATRYVPSKLMVSWRVGSGTFGPSVQLATGAGLWDMRLGIACDGSVTLLWSDGVGARAATLPGTGSTPGACDGRPAGTTWGAAQLISAGAAALPDLAVNGNGDALAVWQEGAPGAPTAIAAALRPAGGAWQPAQVISAGSGQSTWNPKPALDAAGNAAVGYLDGTAMVVTRRPAGGAWAPPETVSGTQAAYYPAFAMSAGGDLLVAWLALDAAGSGSIWQRTAPAGGSWTAAARLSAPAESANWPSAAYAGDGSVAVVGWVDNATNGARASVFAAGRWARSTLGPGWWGGTVPVAAGSGTALAGWAVPGTGNPNAARLVARIWQ